MRLLVPMVILLAAMCLPVQAEDRTGSIMVDLKGFRSNDGRATVVLYDSAKPFPKQAEKAVKILRTNIKDKKAQIAFEKIPYGEYAFVVLHDENTNGKMDYSAFGVPKEGYAFSNNARGTLGPPDYTDAAFKLDKPKITQAIEVGY